MKRFLGLFISLFVMLLFGASVSVSSQNEALDACQGNNGCIYMLIDEKKEYTYCLAANNSDACYLRFALLDVEPALCSETSNSSSCYLSYAKKTKDISVCSAVKDTEYCIFTIAYEKNDPTICAKAQDEEFCVYSLALSYGTAQYCDLLGENYKKLCRVKLIDNEYFQESSSTRG